MLWHILISLAFADGPTKLPLNHVRGKQLYDDLCFQCHGSLALAENEIAKATGAPALAGRIPSEDYKDAITVIQEGRGVMPSYEMTLDKHDSKRILIYLSRLDSETGLDPNPQDYEDQKKKDEDKKEEDKKKTPRTLQNMKLVDPQKLRGHKKKEQDSSKENKQEEKKEDEK